MEIDLIGAVGEEFEGFTEKQVGEMLADAGGESVTVRINSPGGYASVGVGIYNRLDQYAGDVRVEVMGMAASAASAIAMAGGEVLMARGSQLMIHNAWGVTIGDTVDHERALRALDAHNRSLADIYAAKTGRSAEDMLELMAAETYLTADEAIEMGFADGRLESKAGETPQVEEVARAREAEAKAIRAAADCARQRDICKAGKVRLATLRRRDV